MSKGKYLLYAISKGFLKNLDWYYTFLTIVNSDNYSNEYISIVNGKFLVKVDEELLELEGYISGTAVYSITDKVSLAKNTLASITTDIDTSIGYLLLNYILVEFPFNGKIAYINEKFFINKYEERVGELLANEEITVPEYKVFVNNCSFLEKFSRIVTVSATEKGITPPEGLMEYKKKITIEFDNKYGKIWREDPPKVVEYETLLKEYMNVWLKDDPANNKFLGGKIKNNAMFKKYLSFGLAIGFEQSGEPLVQVDESLLEGYPRDKVKLAKMFNTSRSASFDRGHETQKGGSVAKDILRATSSITITDGDCKVTYGKKIKVRDKLIKNLVGRYIIVNGVSTPMTSSEEVSKYTNKFIEIRSTQYCKSPGNTFCKVCVGQALANYKTGISLVETQISAAILINSLKKMHNTTISTIDIDFRDTIK